MKKEPDLVIHMREKRAKMVDERGKRDANRGRGTAEPLGYWRGRRKLFEQRSLASAHRSRHRSIMPRFPSCSCSSSSSMFFFP